MLYTLTMESYSVAQTREHFAEILDQAGSAAVEVTRRGQPVAYIVGPDMFHKLTHPDASYLFSSPDVTPAHLSITEFAALQPTALAGNESLSDVLNELREDRV